MSKLLLSHLRQLDLDLGCSLEDVRQSYRSLSFIWHPDRQPENYRELANVKIQAINSAYEWLSSHSDDLSGGSLEGIVSTVAVNNEIIKESYRAKSTDCVRCHGSGMVSTEINWKNEFENETCEICGGRGKVVVDERNRCRDCKGEGLNPKVTQEDRRVWIDEQMALRGWVDRNLNPKGYKRLWLRFHREHLLCSSCQGSGYFYHRRDVRSLERRNTCAADFLRELKSPREDRKTERRSKSGCAS